MLLVAIAVLSAAILVLLLRRSKSPPDFDRHLDRLESRLVTDLNHVRDGVTTAIANSGDNASKAQHELAVELRAATDETRAQVLDVLVQRFESIRAGLADALAASRASQDQRLDNVAHELGTMKDAQTKALHELQEHVQKRLDEVRHDNEEKLEKMRVTVEEKLQSTLEARLGESFRQVSERLEQVQSGLGEMRVLASGVGDLKRVLTNVRSRGTFGEVQLSALLEQVLTADQYGVNVNTVPASAERVEFAIKMPGRDNGAPVYLPVDAKFPQADYQRLQQAYDDGDVAAADEAKKALRQCALGEARTIREKYLSPPHTTDFALMFLATEGLYAEVLRIPGLVEELQRARVIPVGPTNLHALLNSLQMGFRTLAIEKRSSEVWNVLAGVKTEFAKFGTSLEAVSKKLQEASNKIDDTARRSRVLEKSLRSVETLPTVSQTVSLEEPSTDSLDAPTSVVVPED